jgi:hypothetical protein
MISPDSAFDKNPATLGSSIENPKSLYLITLSARASTLGGKHPISYFR